MTAQERYYEDKIRANPNWKFAGIYSDVGSGTTVKGRKRFNALISACRRGKVDMVLIKSAQRFARNTVDALKTIRMLRRWKVDIYFESDDIHTLEEDSEFMLTLICARAQDESESKSSDIKWGIQKSFENPDSKYYQRKCYGYRHDKDGKLVIDEKEAEVVRMIFRMADEGASLSQIAQTLQEEDIPSLRGKATWSRETLRKILHNEKYHGTVVLQKTFIAFSDSTNILKETLISILDQRKKLPKYLPFLKETTVIPASNTIFDYQFISRLNIDKLNTEYFLTHIRKVLRAQKDIDWETISESTLKEIVLKYDGTKPILQFFKEAMLASIEDDFLPKNVIIYQGMDKSEELSSGLNAKIYFDLLSYENTRDGIYIIDQPEDNISQSAIKTYLLDRFKTMGENRQILMVTHNPQFIVNLDVDNLIYVFKSGDTLNVYSGALEYADDTYSILDIVAQNIDGGLDSIQKRWKRYEKVTNI